MITQARIIRFIVIACAAAMCAAQSAQEKLPPVKWTARAVSGAQVSVPAQKPSLILFVRPDQPQSREAMKYVAAHAQAAQVVLVVSGPQAADQAAALDKSDERDWPIVADVDYAASGLMAVHVWPTTIIVSPAGEQVAHLAGLPKSFASDLAAYLDRAAGKIDDQNLQQRLATHDVVTDTPAEKAARHVQIAQRLLERGNVAQARAELAEAGRLQPDDPMIQLTLARALLLLKQPAEAVAALEKIPADALAAWQVNTLRGRALADLGRWEEARTTLNEALKINPQPAETWYELGRVYEHSGDWQRAAEAYRRAFETSDSGRKLAPATERAQTP